MFRNIAFGATALVLTAAVTGCHESASKEDQSPPTPPATSNSEAPDYVPMPILIPDGSGGSSVLFI